MCGLAGYINLSHRAFSLQEHLLHAMAETLEHRGPNGYRIWTSALHQIGLMHRRLSIVDLSEAGFQPMVSKDGNLVVCCNGEIYNHPTLRAELEKLGYVYFSNSDTETLLYAYQEWGIQFLERLEGMFTIILFDAQKNELYLVRDHIGIKPLYFSMQAGILSFASEIKALWQLPWLTKSINKNALSHYLTFLVTPAPITLYEGMYKLPPGFYIKVDEQRNVTFRQWYNPVTAPRIPRSFFASEEAVIQELRSLLRSSIKKMMMADVPLGVFLSGGIDSSLNVALMAELTDKVKTFNISFEDGPEYSEVSWARKVARLYNTEHHELVINEQDAFSFFQKMIFHQDEPLGDCVCVPLYFVSNLLRSTGVPVVQVGEGSDELFCGYSAYTRYLKMAGPWAFSQRVVPSVARKGIYRAARALFPEKYNRLDMIHNWAAKKELFWGGNVVFSEQWKQQFFYADAASHDAVAEQIFSGMFQGSDTHSVVSYYTQELQALDPDADMLKRMTYLELKHRLPELLLMRVDKMTMATGVEARVPFLDHKLVEFALQIPSHLKYKNNTTKYILKKACEGILPHEIIYRKKVGFAAPTTRWFTQGTQFYTYFNDLLHSNAPEWEQFFSVEKIRHMVTQTRTGSVDYSYQLWAIQNFMGFYEHQ